jgi:hypothetical protein
MSGTQTTQASGDDRAAMVVASQLQCMYTKVGNRIGRAPPATPVANGIPPPVFDKYHIHIYETYHKSSYSRAHV